MDSDDRKTVKQQRAEARAAKVLAYQKEVKAQQRRRRITIASSVVGALAVVGLFGTIIVTSGTPKQRPEDIQIDGVRTFEGLTANHVDPNPVDYKAKYDMDAPAGGDHSQIWLNCGVYTQPQQNENAVHALEHGAIWLTYDPAKATDEQIAELRKAAPSTYTIISPYPGLNAPFVASAWGAQLEIQTPSDERLSKFIDKYWMSANAPEPGAACVGALDGPGRVA